MSEEGMTDVDLGPAAEDPLSLLGAVRRAPPPPLPTTRAPPPPPPTDSPETMLRKALGGSLNPPPAKPAVVRTPPAKPVKPVVSPRQPQRDWAALLGFEGAAVQPLSPSPASDELKRRASAAPAHTALNACAQGGSLDAVSTVARHYDADGFRDSVGAAALAVALAHGDAGQALLLLRAATRRLGLVEQRPILDACATLLAKTDPELHSKWDRLQNTATAFLDGAFSSLHVKDASQLWASLITEPELASSALAACCIRGRVALLDDGPIVVSQTNGLVNEARWLLTPRKQPGVAVAEFGEGPLGILLTKRPRGLVVSSFSKPRSEAVPRVGDALCAVNGRQIPNDSTLNDAVAILKGVGRPVLVGFRPATAEELRSERPPEPTHWPVERKPSPPPTRAQTDLQALASYARSAVETVTEAPPVDHGELPPGLDARPPPPLTTAPVAADGWAVATLPGEVLFARTNARLQDYVRARSGSNQLCGCVIDGELHVTSYRVVFHPIGCGSVPSFASQSTDWEMPVRALTACSLKVDSGHKLSFKCKDGQRRVFTCAPRDGASALACARAVHALAFSSASDAFARAYKNASQNDETFARHLPKTSSYSLRDEYANSVLRGPAQDHLKVIRNEHALDICETYPLELVVPSATTDLELRRVAAYRSKGRLPVIIWSHPTNGATISRSSQPKPGVQNKRSSDDERYLDNIRRLAQGQRMVIVDARSKVATQGNRVMGLGTELVRYYEGIEMFYGNIANIHAARDSLAEVQKLCFARDLAGNDSESGGATFWGKLDGTKWLSQVHSILCAAVKTVELVHYERTAVLVHCSDGWDRTPQITCLALMLLEKRFRTIDGFLTLLQKEWVDFGHKFDERCGHTDESASDQRSPVFLLFVDCCFQLLQQFPSAFEFNQDLLLLLLDQLNACRFGTFLENNQRRRSRKNLDDATKQVWGHVAAHFEDVRNGAYVVDDDAAPLIPSLHARNVRLFEAYFRRFDAARVPLAPARTFY